MSFGKPKENKPETLGQSAAVYPLSAASAGSSSAPTPKGEAFLGTGSTVKGTISFEGPVQIDGIVEGEINASELLTIGKSAQIKATVRGSEIVVYGTIQGDIHAGKKLSLRKPARVLGNISGPAVSIEEGVEFEGSCSMKGASKLPNKA